MKILIKCKNSVLWLLKGDEKSAENLIKDYLSEDQSAFENNPFLKFYSEVDFA